MGTKSNKKKGRDTKLLIIQSLQNQGFQAQDVENNNRFAKHRDLWNLFDIVAVRGHKFLFIQAKTNKWGSCLEIRNWAEMHCPRGGFVHAAVCRYNTKTKVLEWREYPEV